MFRFLIHATLPLAISAACSYFSLTDCPKCGEGAIAASYTRYSPCNCNDNAGISGKVCPKSGAPTYPDCCNTDGTKKTNKQCNCGTKSCSSGEFCMKSTNTCMSASPCGSGETAESCYCAAASDICNEGQACDTTGETCKYPDCVTGSDPQKNKCKCKSISVVFFIDIFS
jgi:hypothetical protein